VGRQKRWQLGETGGVAAIKGEERYGCG
jgi:hypothetical protein